MWLNKSQLLNASSNEFATEYSAAYDEEVSKAYRPLVSPILLSFLNVYVSSFLVAIGVFGNCISFLVFLRSSYYAPKIITRNSLILLTISNSVYLLLVWYYRVFPKLSNTFKLENDLIRFYLVNSNSYVCKLTIYLINLAIALCALITVAFSAERAFAINFPLKARNLRSNHRLLFKSLFLTIILFSFILPSYNLALLELREVPTHGQQCGVQDVNKLLYFKLTVLFVIKTTAVPFLVISVSNISIVMAIYKKRRLLNFYKSRRTTELADASLRTVRRFAFSNKARHSRRDFYMLGETLRLDTFEISQNSSDRTCTSPWSSFKRSSCKSANRAALAKNSIYVQKIFSKNLMITKMLITISASFVLLHLPYLIAWSIHATAALELSNDDDADIARFNDIYSVVQITELLNLLNYSIAGLLYFASGRMYRQHLYALLGIKNKTNQIVRI